MNDLLDGAHEEYQQRGYHMFRAGFPSEQINDLANLIRRRIPTYPGLIRRNSGELEVNEYLPEESYRPWGTDQEGYTALVAYPLLNGHCSPFPKALEPLAAALPRLVPSPALG